MNFQSAVGPRRQIRHKQPWRTGIRWAFAVTLSWSACAVLASGHGAAQPPTNATPSSDENKSAREACEAKARQTAENAKKAPAADLRAISDAHNVAVNGCRSKHNALPGARK